MSTAALILAVRDIIRIHLPTTAEFCDINIDGRPPFFTGDLFISVWSSAWDPGPNNPTLHFGIQEMYEFTCTVTKAAGHVPDDRRAHELWIESVKSIEPLARCIIAVVNRFRYKIQCLANTYILSLPSECGETTSEPIDICKINPDARGLFMTPPRWIGSDPTPRPVGPEWFTAESSLALDEVDDALIAARGYVLDVRFGQVQRMQHMARMA